MIIKFYGTRGSIPVCDPGFTKFGGNTTCVAVYWEGDNDFLAIFDAGTGIRKLGKEIMQEKFGKVDDIAIIFSHFHWDHIQGFPFFAPAYDPSKHIAIEAYGEGVNVASIKEVFLKQMESTFFPISLDNMGAQFSYHIGKYNFEFFPKGSLTSYAHSHPGGAHSYRYEHRGKSMVYCTDIEHGDKIDKGIVKLSKNAHILIHDAQYTPEELPKYKGWGHSSWEQAIQVAEMADVKALYLTHHDPDHTDDFLLEVEYQCQRRFPNSFLAREGTKIHL